MKNATFLVPLVVILWLPFFASCQKLVFQSNDSNTNSSEQAAEIKFSSPTQFPKNIFVFSTWQGEGLAIWDVASIEALAKSLDSLGFTLSDIGTGNSFVINAKGKKFLCTASHVCIGKEKFNGYIQKISSATDISVIDYRVFEKHGTGPMPPIVNPYEIDTSFTSGDSVIIRGILTDSSGKSRLVSIRGIGYLDNIDGIPDEMITQKGAFSGTGILLTIPENIDLRGLSGAPAFNQAGKVVGVYSGRVAIDYGGITTEYYLFVSLF
ncbi:MAG: hypothetical protein KBD52_02320 [Candidatus Pacebacteria bacterium]|nr:hypothetical protein [Candidatus Paceibacterota bacterium]